MTSHSTVSPLRLRRAAALLAVPVFVAACGSSSQDALVEPDSPAAASAGTSPAGTSPVATGGPMTITVAPGAGSAGVGPTARVTVTGQNGTLTGVRVFDADGRVLAGAFDATRASWKATDPVRFDSKYTVRAEGTGGDGRPVVKTSTFATDPEPKGGRLHAISVTPSDGDTVGVAQPLAVGFDRPVRNKRAVQDALEVTTTPRVEGAWYWIDDYYVDFRPQGFWPAGTKVALNARLEGVGSGNGVSGQGDRKVSFTVGRAQTIKVDVKRHRLQVLRGAKAVKTFQVSTGKKGWETRNGTKVLMDKETDKHWTNEEINAKEQYSYYSKYAMRMTNSGEFVHDAPWNKGNIGEANTSHGCVGLDPKDMVWLFEHSIVGDPIVVTGSPKPYKDLINRYADWNIPWVKWKAGNA
jgi:lipoprotein-anchoring transpeptidase ErfK/SrfK